MSYINAYHKVKDKQVVVWERVDGRRIRKVYDAPYYFYVGDDGREFLNLSKESPSQTLFGDTVYKVTCNNKYDMEGIVLQCRRMNIKTYESDISPESRVLSTHYYQKDIPNLHVTFLDIEVDYNEHIGHASVDNPYAPINSVAYHNTWENKTKLIAVPPPEWDYNLDETLFDVADITLVESEYDLLKLLMSEIQDSDGLCGWNSDFFDIPYIAKRLDVLHETTGRFTAKPANMLGFDGAPDTRYRQVEIYGREQTIAEIGGRLRMDYLVLFKKFEMAKRGSYKLAAISSEVLPNMPKLEYEGSLASLYRTNFNFFMRYNIRDVECLLGFEEALGYVQLANIMYHESTGFFANINGTIRLADYSIINHCHYVLNQVVPDGPVSGGSTYERTDAEEAEGALVLDPQVGMHEMIGSIDVKSLYPSGIRSVNISPEKLVAQFVGNVLDFEELAADSDRPLSLVFEDNGQAIVHTAKEWREILQENKWAVSGYGTVFDQSSQGVIPAILSTWYDTRKRYQKLLAEAEKQGDYVKRDYYDKMQYCYKIKLNSLYGALLNTFFRFYDPRLGESTTGTGRAILRFMCGRTNEILNGTFDMFGDAVLYGDTDSVYFRTYADTVDDAIIVADGVAELVNDSFLSFVRRTFLCQPGYDNIIAVSREVVALRGIFVTPKRYVLKVVNMDGKPCNKLKIMGLDTKKTILPQYVQKSLNGFLERLLDGEDWNDIAEDVVALKDKMKNEIDVIDLGLPKGVNKVEHYTVEKANNQKARLPGHVRASIYYNECLKKFQDTKSVRIMSGMRVNIFYLRTIVGKDKSIAIPVDSEEIPTWFYEHIEIDKSMQLERLIDNPLKNVLKAIGKEPPTHQSLFIHKTLEF